MFGKTLSLVAMVFLACGVVSTRAEDAVAAPVAPAQSCPCKPMSVSVRASGGVSVKNFTFVSDPITINVGDTVTWTNSDNTPHTATSDTQVFDTGTLSNGQSSSFTFTTAGTFPYHCNIHSFMKGSVIVNAVGPSAPKLLDLKATVNADAPFIYTIAADTAPITLTATLPSGFQLNGAILTGTFAMAGKFNIPITATNANGSDSRNLAVTVKPSVSGLSDVTGTWVGKLKSKHYEQEGTSGKPESPALTLVIVQTGSDLAVTATIGGKPLPYITTGQYGHGNLGLRGAAGTDRITITAHQDKKGTTLKGLGIRFNATGDEEFTFSAKKQ